MSYRDIIADTLDRLIAAGVQLTAAQRQRVEQQARQEWGGRRHYVPRHDDRRTQQLAQRNAHIRNAHAQGESVDKLARDWGISVKRVQQIIS